MSSSFSFLGNDWLTMSGAVQALKWCLDKVALDNEIYRNRTGAASLITHFF